MSRTTRKKLAGMLATAAAGLAVMGTLFALPASAASAFTITSPLTAANDFITGLPSCGVGPVGLLDDGKTFLVTDYCNSTTYKYDVSDSQPVLALSLQNGLTHGLTLLNGVHYGVASNVQSVIPAGIWSFWTCLCFDGFHHVRL